MLIEGRDAPASPALVVYSIRLSGNELRFGFLTSTGRSYVIEGRDGPTAGAWTEVPGSLQTSVGAALEVSLPIPQSPPQQFFRVKQLP